MRFRAVLWICLLTIICAAGAGAAEKRKPAQAKTRHFMATAHSVEGETAAGTRSRPGTAAADPTVLPLGTRIRVHGAGGYSGEYSVEDTGRAVKGHEIDLYMTSNAEAKRFGRKRVRVTILETPKP